jgi:hypothetical protein
MTNWQTKQQTSPMTPPGPEQAGIRVTTEHHQPKLFFQMLGALDGAIMKLSVTPVI